MNVLDYLILIVAVFLIVIVMMQGSKDDINDAFNGSKSELFKNQKSRGLELFLQRATAITGISFIVLVIVAAVIRTI